MGTEIAIVWGRPGPAKDGPARCEAPLDIHGLLAAVQEFSRSNSLEVQLFDASAIVNADHLRSAAMHALRARERGTMRSSSVGMEMILYAAGRRQIREAMVVVGLGEQTRRIAAIVVGSGAKKMGGRLLAALNLSPLTEGEAAGGRDALGRLGISVKGAAKDQLDALVLEQVALLDIER